MKLYYGWRQIPARQANQALQYSPPDTYSAACAWIDDLSRIFYPTIYLGYCRPEIEEVLNDRSQTKRIAVKLTLRAEAILLAKDQPSNYLLNMLLNTLELVEEANGTQVQD